MGGGGLDPKVWSSNINWWGEGGGVCANMRVEKPINVNTGREQIFERVYQRAKKALTPSHAGALIQEFITQKKLILT